MLAREKKIAGLQTLKNVKFSIESSNRGFQKRFHSVPSKLISKGI